MSRIRSKQFPNYYSMTRILPQIFCNSCDNKRSILLLIFILFGMPIIYLFSYTTFEETMLENADICSKLLETIYNRNQTLCNAEANHRGNKQRIISLSIFGPKENKLFVDERFPQLIIPFINEAKLLFPTWTIRLYADQSTINRLNLDNLTKTSTNIDICNVNEIPILGNVGEYLSGKLWRFLPALDPTVDFVSSRDLDSPLIEREQVIIEQFIDSPYLFLTIRDHPLHGIPILGGLWSSAIYRNRLLFLRLFSILLDKNKVQQYSLVHDQTLLMDIVWPKVKQQTLVFDSYTCEQFTDGHQYPFPTQRPSRDCHLGCIRPCCQNSSRIILSKPCPIQCRPKNHTDWLYC